MDSQSLKISKLWWSFLERSVRGDERYTFAFKRQGPRHPPVNHLANILNLSSENHTQNKTCGIKNVFCNWKDFFQSWSLFVYLLGKLQVNQQWHFQSKVNGQNWLKKTLFCIVIVGKLLGWEDEPHFMFHFLKKQDPPQLKLYFLDLPSDLTVLGWCNSFNNK